MKNLVKIGVWMLLCVPGHVLSTSERNHYNLDFSTYICGMNGDYIRDVCVDNQGNIYVAGRAGEGLPVQLGACQANFVDTVGMNLGAYGKQNGFVAKFTPGGQLIWASYVGSGQLCRDIAVDDQADSPTAGTPYQSTYGSANGNYDGNAFLTIITPDLRSLVYSSFVGKQCSITGRNAYGGFHASALAPDGSWVVGGSWYSSGWSTIHAFQSTYNSGGNGHAVLARFVPAAKNVHPRHLSRRSK
jgi:hypothetical protein